MASQAELKKQTVALLNRYLGNYAEKYGKGPTDFNRFKHQWGFEAMISDLGQVGAQVVVDYYFRTERYGHPVQYLLYNYEKLANIIRDVEDDKVERIRLREETKKRVAEWEAKNGNTRG